MEITRDTARELTNKLPPQAQKGVAMALMNLRQEYLMSNTCVSFPQFFFACNQPLFKDMPEEELEYFLAIDDPNTFVDYAIYYGVEYILKNAEQGNG